MPPPCLHEVLFVIVPLINVVIPPASEPVPPLHLTPPPLPPEAARIERNYEDARDYTLRHAKHEFDEDVAEAIAVRLEAIDMLGDPYEKTVSRSASVKP
jgi:hypothetical protein